MTPTQIKNIRTSLKWSLIDMAKRTGYEKYQIDRMERGILSIPHDFKKLLTAAIKAYLTYTKLHTILITKIISDLKK